VWWVPFETGGGIGDEVVDVVSGGMVNRIVREGFHFLVALWVNLKEWTRDSRRREAGHLNDKSNQK